MVRDENLIKIKEVIKNIFPDCRMILFGSRSRENFESQSDYDILVIVKNNLNIKDKFQYENIIRKHLAELGIDDAFKGIEVKDISRFAVRIRYAEDFYIPDMEEVKFY